jgi:hypothetical protein
MTPAAILTQSMAAGLILWPEGCDRLHVKGPAAVRDRWVPLLKEHKAALIRHLWVERLHDHFEERAAILEHDAHLPRPEAEEQARRATALLARNLSAPWCALREALGDAALPDSPAPVNRTPYPLPEWATTPDRQPCQQGVFRRDTKKA